MARFLFAWELGANLGHLTRLRSVALLLKQRGHALSFALRDLVGSRELLGRDLGPSFQAPLMLHGKARDAYTLADVLLISGFDSSRALGGLVDGWLSIIEASGCDALIVDHAPTALLAARVLGKPVVHIGQGFSIPPRVSPLPVFRDWAAVGATHAEEADALALRRVNEVLALHGALPLPALCDLFHPPRTLLCAWPELDHYAGRGRSPDDYLGPDSEFMPGVVPAWPDVAGPRVLAYLRASHPDHADLLRALDAAGCATLCFMPDRGAARAKLPESERIRYETQPVDLAQALPTCSLVVCHAGQATLAQALQFGIPTLMLPTQAEQFLVARQVERHGAGLNASVRGQRPYGDLLAELLAPRGSHAQAAGHIAERYREFRSADLSARIADTAVACLPAAG